MPNLYGSKHILLSHLSVFFVKKFCTKLNILQVERFKLYTHIQK